MWTLAEKVPALGGGFSFELVSHVFNGIINEKLDDFPQLLWFPDSGNILLYGKYPRFLKKSSRVVDTILNSMKDSFFSRMRSYPSTISDDFGYILHVKKNQLIFDNVKKREQINIVGIKWGFQVFFYHEAIVFQALIPSFLLRPMPA